MSGTRKIKNAWNTGAGNGIGSALSRQIVKVQRAIADCLNRKTAGWSPLKMKVALILFCLAAGNTSLFIAGKAIFRTNSPPVILPDHQGEKDTLKNKSYRPAAYRQDIQKQEDGFYKKQPDATKR